MTTAHRPTWAPAMGHEEQGGLRKHAPSRYHSAKDMPSQMTLKVRQPGQGTVDELGARDFRAELEAKERKHFKLDKLEDFESAIHCYEREREMDRKLLESTGPSGASTRGLIPSTRDADDVDASSGPESSSEEDSEDDMEALQAELEKLKAEKAAERAREAAEEKARKEKEERDELIKSNPMLRQELGLEEESSFQVKRRWDDDVVFKNQARTEPKQQKRFINDTVRSDFHKRFLDRYIK